MTTCVIPSKPALVDDFDVVANLGRAELALRVRAAATGSGLERLRLDALADVLAAELRIQNKRVADEAEIARRRPRRPRKPRVTSTEQPAA